MAGMILVNNPGNWSGTFESLTHADWNGCTFADLVFPFFVFILGAAMPFSFARRVSRDDRHRDLYVRIAQRSAWLIALGLMLNVVAAAPTVVSMRLPGVLQRIGLVYLMAAPIIIHARSGWRLVALGALVLGHWALLTEPILASAGGLAQTHNLAGSIDRSVFGSHTLTTTGDPEGLLGTIPAVGTALLGSIAGDWLRETHSRRVRVAGLVGGGLAALGLGLLWATVLPLNKSLWTGSFVLFTGGIATLTLAICYLLFDVYDYRRWAQPLVVARLQPARDLLSRRVMRTSARRTVATRSGPADDSSSVDLLGSAPAARSRRPRRVALARVRPRHRGVLDGRRWRCCTGDASGFTCERAEWAIEAHESGESQRRFRAEPVLLRAPEHCPGQRLALASWHSATSRLQPSKRM